ncbi:hypothetical protein [Ascidiimonas sp. W6]|uniref:hypothetical protein n=1 Tax=Ascidiimonas meishanensis TaxID=3128903 RepID=UPI0030ED45A7
MPVTKINFKQTEATFPIAKKPTENKLIDTSFAQSERATGKLRLPAVNNGRYESRHPILNPEGHTVGYLSKAANTIGYTWNCVYAGHCFWLTNMTFHDTFNGGKYSNISLVAEAGTFLFSSTRKFKVIKAFALDGSYAGFTRAFKLLNNERELFYLTNKGFALFNTYGQNLIAQADFQEYLSENTWDFALSPKVPILAIVASSMGEKDPVDGAYRYKNFVRLYSMKNGELMGEKILEMNGFTRWAIYFSKNGRFLKIASPEITLCFELTAP